FCASSGQFLRTSVIECVSGVTARGPSLALAFFLSRRVELRVPRFRLGISPFIGQCVGFFIGMAADADRSRPARNLAASDQHGERLLMLALAILAPIRARQEVHALARGQVARQLVVSSLPALGIEAEERV